LGGWAIREIRRRFDCHRDSRLEYRKPPLQGCAQLSPIAVPRGSLIGVGEASYATIAPSLISDVFPKEKRGTALGIFFAAVPLGFALGYLLGGLAPFFDRYFGLHSGWASHDVSPSAVRVC